MFAAQETHNISLPLVKFLPFILDLTQVLPLKTYGKLKFDVPFSTLFIIFNNFINLKCTV